MDNHIKNQYLYSQATSKIIKSFYNVYNELSFGFLEKVYENAMLIELRGAGLVCQAQVPIKVYFHSVLVGQYFADIIVDGCIIIENKAMESLCPEHEAQLLNYLKATYIEVGLLLNFGKKPQFKRKVYTNDLKNQRLSVISV